MDGQARDGSFDTLRLIAALMVFHAHSFAMIGLAEPQSLTFSWGTTAVVIFFAMSGYWVSRSALERSVASFTAARALRILPGLLVCCLMTIVICALATSLNVGDYVRSRDTWRWLQNAFPFFVPQRETLPGVFEDGAERAANGSLWTLPMEVLCYLAALVAARFGPRGMRVAIALMAVFTLGVVCGPIGVGAIKILVTTMERTWLAIFGGAFFLGAALNGARNRTLVGLMAAALLWLQFPPHSWPAIYAIGMVFYSCLALWIGRNLNLDRLVTRGRDLSYGVYIYAFPIEQLAARALPPHGPLSFATYWASALVVTLGLAWLSWVAVEQPALRLKPRLARAIERGLGAAAIRPRPARGAT